MPGLESVYLRQGGTGAAAILGQSSWDPIAFAKYAGGLKMAQQQAEQQKKDKQKQDALKLLQLNPKKTLAEDRNAINNFGDFYQQFVANKLLSENRNISQQDWNDAYKMKNEFDQMNNDSNQHDIALQNYLGQLKGTNSDQFDTKSMELSGSKYANPELYIDSDPQIQKTFTPILEYYMQDPFYGSNPQLAITAAKTHWRNDYGRDYVTTPILKPESLMELFNKNIKGLLPDYETLKSVTDSNGNTVTKKDYYSFAEDTPVTVTHGDGSTEEITIPGRRSLIEDSYNTDPTTNRSVNQLFENQDDSVKENYTNQYGEDAAKEWYKDTAQDWGIKSVTESTYRADQKKGGYGFGNKTYPFEVTLDEGDRNYNRLGVSPEGKKNTIVYSYAKVPVRGVSFGSDKNKYPKVKVNPKRIFNQDSYSWMQTNTSQDFDFTVSGVYEMPALNQSINLKDPQYADVLKWATEKYGSKIKTKDQSTGILNNISNGNFVVDAGTPVSEEEADILNKINPGLVKSQKFATGQINGYDVANNKSYEIPGATIPWDEVSEQVNLATDADWGSELQDQYGGGEDWWQKNIQYKKPKVTVTEKNPVETIKETFKEGGGKGKGSTINLDEVNTTEEKEK